MKKKFRTIIVIIDINDKTTVNNAGKYDAEVITGAKMSMFYFFSPQNMNKN